MRRDRESTGEDETMLREEGWLEKGAGVGRRGWGWIKGEVLSIRSIGG